MVWNTANIQIVLRLRRPSISKSATMLHSQERISVDWPKSHLTYGFYIYHCSSNNYTNPAKKERKEEKNPACIKATLPKAHAEQKQSSFPKHEANTGPSSWCVAVTALLSSSKAIEATKHCSRGF